jgi:hypothetical protein
MLISFNDEWEDEVYEEELVHEPYVQKSYETAAIQRRLQVQNYLLGFKIPYSLEFCF